MLLYLCLSHTPNSTPNLSCWMNDWVIFTQSCPTLCNPMGYSLPGSSVHEISQERILEWVAISFFSPFTLLTINRFMRSLNECCSHTFWKTNSLRRTVQRVECRFLHQGPKAESPPSQGPRPVFVKTLYTLSVWAQTHLPEFPETSLNKGKERYNQS